MVILLRYTSAFNEVIYADFYAKILYWNFCIVDENSRILVVVFISKLNFSFRFVDENYRIFIVVVVFVTKINLFSSTKKTLIPTTLHTPAHVHPQHEEVSFLAPTTLVYGPLFRNNLAKPAPERYTILDSIMKQQMIRVPTQNSG